MNTIATLFFKPKKMTGYRYPGGLTLRIDYCFYMILFPSTMKTLYWSVGLFNQGFYC